VSKIKKKSKTQVEYREIVFPDGAIFKGKSVKGQATGYGCIL
jgi:hypothetical protein